MTTDRVRALTDTAADLLWLLDQNRWNRARKLLASGEFQAARIAAQRYDRPLVTGTGTEVPDPTFRAAERGTAAEVRASKVLEVWRHELTVIDQHVWFICDTVATMIGEDYPRRPNHRTVEALIVTVDKRVRWLTDLAHLRLRTAVDLCDEDELRELDVSITEAAVDAKALRDGKLWTDNMTPIPSVFRVLEDARQAMKVEQKVEQPKPKKPEGCVSCARVPDHKGQPSFTPIDEHNHSKRSMCRRCGDYTSGEGAWPPVAAVKYYLRTGKPWTWKILEEAKRDERSAS